MINAMKYRNLLPLFGAVSLMMAAIVAAAAQAPVSKKITDKDKVGITGIGSVKIGMPLTKAIDATQTVWNVEPSLDAGDDGCRYAKPQKGLSSLSFMVIGGVIVRADITARGVATISGIQVGDTEERVKSVYPGKITVEKHKYVEKGHYLIYTPADPKDANLRLIFETNGKIVTAYRIGRLPEVSWVEGCL
jgi:hypothetical protein